MIIFVGWQSLVIKCFSHMEKSNLETVQNILFCAWWKKKDDFLLLASKRKAKPQQHMPK